MRPRPTLTDYMVIAISPALIMALVGSLVFFLVEVLYQGQYQTRLQVVLALFVMAAVLIGRISIEEGREYASMFALPLGVVTLLALFRFVEFSGILGRISWLVNIGLIGLIWWCADKLTWDCTVIDEKQDASGEGLLQTVGLDEPAPANAGPTPLDATSDRPTGPAAPPRGLWERFVAARRRPHAPGVWVVYFSMAALPIFGLGQAFIFNEDLHSRRFVFKLLVVYVAAALGLLVTTSFLGLRRYLRQRRLEMPAEMAGAWLGVGGIMIVALLLLCLLLPRRNAEYSITHLPAFAHAPEGLRSSPFGFGNDGPEEEDAQRRVTREDADQEYAGRQGEGEGQKAKDQGAGKQPSGQSGDSSKQQSGEGQQQRSQQGQPQKSATGKAEKGQNDQGGGQQSSDGRQQSEQQPSDPRPPQDQQEQNQPKSPQQNSEGPSKQGDTGEREPERSPQQRQSERSPRQSRQFSPTQLLQRLGTGVGALLKLLYWLAAFLIVGFLLWKYWAPISEAVRNFLQALRDFWSRLFGSGPSREEAVAVSAEPAVVPPRTFASYPNPFQSDLASQVPLPQLVKYSFEAMEAWARERGCGRTPEQTPHEFAQQLAQSQTHVSQEAVQLAELYNRSAYSQDSLPATSLHYLRQVWQRLSSG